MARIILVAAVLALAIAALARLPTLPAAPSATGAAGCTTTVDKRVWPDTVYLGDETSVTVTVHADCARLQVPVHVAFILDNSIDMGGPRIADMRNGIAAFADALDFSVARMGLATYASHVDILSELTADRDAIKAATANFGPRDGANLAMAVRAGRQMLERGRAVAAGPEFQEVMILLVGAPYDSVKADVLAEAQLARDEGMLIVTIASGNPDLDTLQTIASGPSFFYNAGISSQYPYVFKRIVGDVTAVHLTGAQLKDTLPANMPYVWGSGIPAPRVRGRDLSWLYATWPTDGITLTFNVKPGELGRWPVSDGADVTISMDRGGSQTLSLAVPYVNVLAVPTATPIPPTPTITPTPLPPTAAPTATPEPRFAYLPVLLRNHCRPAVNHADVVLVLDTSSSMLELSGQGVAKLDLAQDAASQFVDALALPDDHAAVITFNSTATVLQPLSGELGAVQSALAGLQGHVARGTRLDVGLDAALSVLFGPDRDPSNRPVIVLLTDGQTEDVARARAAAATARAQGVVIYAVGLGADVDGPLLTELAGSTARYFSTPDGAELTRIYLDIAHRTGCAGADTN
jgi:uncharacterized protein YegL